MLVTNLCVHHVSEPPSSRDYVHQSVRLSVHPSITFTTKNPTIPSPSKPHPTLPHLSGAAHQGHVGEEGEEGGQQQGAWTGKL